MQSDKSSRERSLVLQQNSLKSFDELRLSIRYGAIVIVVDIIIYIFVNI